MKVTLWRQDVAMRNVVGAAAQRHDRRSRLFLSIEHEGATGFGEGAPQERSLNGDPSIGEVVDELSTVVVPQLRQMVAREGAPPSWTRAGRLAGPRAASNPAVALVEMALLDRELRASGRDVTELWPALFETPTQATVSLLDLAAPWVVGGAARVRAKTAPGTLGREALERLGELTVPVLLDFNCSATNDEQVLEQVHAVAEVAEVAALEQPFAAGNVADHARLAVRLAVPLSIDEGLRSLRDVNALVRYRAAAMVCVKPARVGGLANARTIVARARACGLAAYLGGFFESPYGRSVNRALAHAGVEEPSDVVDVAVDLDGYERETDPVVHGFGVVPGAEMLARCVLVTSFEGLAP